MDTEFLRKMAALVTPFTPCFGGGGFPRSKMAAVHLVSALRRRAICRWAAAGDRAQAQECGQNARHVRQTFLRYFRDKQRHREVRSAPVIPRGDPSLLLVNAGMNQFKPILLGTVDPRSPMAQYQRVVNSQKCVRAGGKHNDLEDVGRDLYHHTFFEMLGNWSFGDYFKEEACRMAWELLTEVYGIPQDRLYVTFFGGDPALGLTADEETKEIWLSIGVHPHRLLPFGLAHNFWEMGEMGPCGPCTEIHYDHGVGEGAAAQVNTGNPQLVEIWNLVFMQYSREADGSLQSLPQHSVDTGMGLERLVAVLQGKESNYDTDLFTPILDAIHRGDAYPELKQDPCQIMDTINENEAAFLSSLHRGRRIIDRTLQKMDNSQSFPVDVAWSLHRNLGFPLDLISLMLEEKAVNVDTEALRQLAKEEAERLRPPPQSELQQGRVLGIQDINELQRTGVLRTDDSAKHIYTLEDGKYVFSPCQATVVALYEGNSLVKEVRRSQTCGVILDRTNFYSEQGGQTHDLGYFIREGHQDVLLPVVNVQAAGGFVIHTISVPESLHVGDRLNLFVNEGHRLACMVKHTATHLLNYALRCVLGDETEQRGSHITADRLRFDYSIKTPVTGQQLETVEQIVRDVICRDESVYTAEVPLNQVNCIKGLRSIDEVYPDPVRVVSVGLPVNQLLHSNNKQHTSVELCCGTHLLRTGMIQDLVIVSERQLGKGISRILAVTGEDAKEARHVGRVLAEEVDSLTVRLNNGMKSLVDSQRLSKEIGQLTDVVDGAVILHRDRRQLQERLRALHRTVNTAIRKLESREAAEKIQHFLANRLDQALIVDVFPVQSISILMKMVNKVSEKMPHSSVMLLSQLDSGKILCACQVPKDSVSSLSASDWALAVCGQMGGNAGGSKVVAKGMGSSSNLEEIVKLAIEYARNKM
ncbi:alanine--tRNA ligase, mitochondrial isoform X4 [Chiloscyllium plagiosum]|uniref:alanine--tRNA ligase, mitochondrial isoform X4 n=1 Tax=Chiloscyllium plagiosum TaxID=36176 RepID=UPI001CB8804C|nr:alanine--tRNA ligase, mitochondrial isoform X4 [Chiloscyllium plagiosum]